MQMDFEQKLKLAHEKIIRKKEMENRILHLQPEIIELRSKWYVLKENSEKEYADVKELEGHSVSAWLAKLTGKLDEQLERERKEANAAARELHLTETKLMDAERWIKECCVELEILREENIDEEYEMLLQEKRRAMELRQAVIPEEMQEMEAALTHLEAQLALLEEVKIAAAAAETAAKQFDDTISDAKAYMEFAGYGLRNPIEAGLKRKADKNIDAVENEFSEFVTKLKHYQDLFPALDGTEHFHIPFEYLHELCGPHSADNFSELTDLTDKMRKLWARIYESMKLLDQLEEAMQMDLHIKKEQWKQLVYDYQAEFAI